MSLRLPARPVHHLRAEHGLRIDLPGQIDRDRIVDRRLPVVRRHRRELERVLRIVKLERWIVVDYPQVVRIRSRPRGRPRLPAMYRLAPPVDYPRIDQPRDSRRAHLGMQPQVVLAVDTANHGHWLIGDPYP